jgi:hypothetical protein
VEPRSVLEEPRRSLPSEVVQQFLAAENQQSKRLLSDEHFTVDGTMIQA